MKTIYLNVVREKEYRSLAILNVRIIQNQTFSFFPFEDDFLQNKITQLLISAGDEFRIAIQKRTKVILFNGF